VIAQLLIVVGLLGAMGAALVSAVAGLGAEARAFRRLSHALALGSAAIGLVASVAYLAIQAPPLTLTATPIFFGLPLAVDRLSAFFLVLLYAVSLMAAWFGARYTEDERRKYPPRLVLPLTSLFGFGMQGVLLSTGVASFLLFWELMSLSSFFLVMADGEEESRNAALLYLAVAQFGAGALLVGMGLVTGGVLVSGFATLGMSAAALSPGMSALATGLVLFAFASKAGLAPFHAWLPEAHPRAPSHVSALMSGVMLKVAVYGLLRFTWTCWPDLAAPWGMVLAALGLAGAVVAVISANFARDIKRILAWSSVENIGLVFTMLGFAIILRSQGLASLAAAVLGAMFLHLFAHALFKSGLFLGAGVILHATHTLKIEMLGGLANRMPAFAAAMLGLSLAAAALPPFGTFVAEWQLLQATIGALGSRNPEVIVTALAVLVGVAFVAGLAVFAMVRLFAFVFLAEPRSDAARLAHTPATPLGAPVAVLSVAVLALGAVSPWLGGMFPTGVGMANALADGTAAPLDSLSQGVNPAAGLGLLPFALVAAMAAAGGGAWLIRRLMAPAPRVRPSHTWDCGQPIDATMEYTATAFSAPIRHFLRDIVRAEKHVRFRPVTAANPWIRTGEMDFRKAAGLLEQAYYPVAALIEGVGAQLKLLQNGVIQFYIALILATLLLTLWVAL
jgi:formate hydrogenlyase subunit 3/multisubunit Na+/H+ antiporter MnhD subunit